jgi:hypothetical protein
VKLYVLAALATAVRGSQPSGRQPLRRIRIELRRKHNDNQVHDAKSPKRRGNAVMDDFPGREGTHNQRAKAVPANGHAGHQAAPIGEPFYQRRNRANITHAHADPC